MAPFTVLALHWNTAHRRLCHLLPWVARPHTHDTFTRSQCTGNILHWASALTQTQPHHQVVHHTCKHDTPLAIYERVVGAVGFTVAVALTRTWAGGTSATCRFTHICPQPRVHHKRFFYFCFETNPTVSHLHAADLHGSHTRTHHPGTFNPASLNDASHSQPVSSNACAPLCSCCLAHPLLALVARLHRTTCLFSHELAAHPSWCQTSPLTCDTVPHCRTFSRSGVTRLVVRTVSSTACAATPVLHRTAAQVLLTCLACPSFVSVTPRNVILSVVTLL
jgi:hypothetical protein